MNIGTKYKGEKIKRAIKTIHKPSNFALFMDAYMNFQYALQNLTLNATGIWFKSCQT